MSPYPEHDKLSALNGANNIVGDFIEWLSEEGFILAKSEDKYDLFPASETRDQLIAKYFGIDPKRLEAEKVAMLDAIRKSGPF